MSSGSGGYEAFAFARGDVQDASSLGERAPRQSANELSGERARAGRVRCSKRAVWGYFGRYP